MALSADGLATPVSILQVDPPGLWPKGDLSLAQEGVFSLVMARPGSTIQEIADHLQLSHTTASYHLAKLEKKSLVTRQKEGRVVRYYRANADNGAARLTALMSDERRRRIIGCLVTATRSQWPANELARHLDLNHSFLMRNLQIMSAMGFTRILHPRSRYYIEATPLLLQTFTALKAGEPGREAPAAAPAIPAAAKPL